MLLDLLEKGKHGADDLKRFMAQNRKSRHHFRNLEEDDHVISGAKRTNLKSSLLFLIPLLLISCAILASAFSSSNLNSFLRRHDVAPVANGYHQTELISADKVGPCSSPLPAGVICCDRSDYHSDVCFMSGDVRTHSPSSSIFLRHSSVDSHSESEAPDREERIKPYTRKWEAALAPLIPELRLRHDVSGSSSRCDVSHDAPALVFFAGGYTGNLFHAFNDGIVPLYITSHLLRRRVVLVVMRYRRWWHHKYSEILSQLSAYPPVDFDNDNRTHCFPGAVVGLRYHGTFAVDPKRLKLNNTISDFKQMLADAYASRGGSSHRNQTHRPPKMIIISRTKTRRIENEAEVVQISKDVGFDVEVLRPSDIMPMSRIYESLSSCDVMMGVHGAALTHMLFLRPGAAFVQIVPLGLDKYADYCYGAGPAAELRLRYELYKVLPQESSLYRKYGAEDPVVTAPENAKEKGWEVIKKVYLDGQDVRLNGTRVQEMLSRIFHYVVSQRASPENGSSIP